MTFLVFFERYDTVTYMEKVGDTRVTYGPLILTPEEIERRLPLDERAAEVVFQGRRDVESILRGEDTRFLVIVGPCSIHDPVAALGYARRLAPIREQYKDRLNIIMRVYFEKPRTATGWKGFVNDPDRDGSCDMNKGLYEARKLLIEISRLGLPIATEFLDPLVPQFIADLIAWGAVGARTTESQTHREMASGLSMPIGFKNGTNGDLNIAINAIKASMVPHSFFGIDREGRVQTCNGQGNPWTHLILRGGFREGKYYPNYRHEHITKALKELSEAGIVPRLIVDCSHANAGGDYRMQSEPLRYALAVRKPLGRVVEPGVVGVMLESFLEEGKQSIDAVPLVYGQSITDACIGWKETEALLEEAYNTLGRNP